MRMSEDELLYFNKYKRTKDVTLDECYMGGKNCGTCMHCKDHDSNWNWFEYNYCSCAPLHKNQ